jgi:orotidine-5'-phosphate decarboxylase
LRILAVTVLTSSDDADLAAAGYDCTGAELVAKRAAQARESASTAWSARRGGRRICAALSARSSRW